MSAAQWRLYWNERGALSNQRKAAEDPLELLKFTMRAIILVQRRKAELSTKRASYCNQRQGRGILVTDAALSAQLLPPVVPRQSVRLWIARRQRCES